MVKIMPADDDFCEDEPVCCALCGGPAMFLGALGKLNHFRCRNCGITFHREDDDA